MQPFSDVLPSRGFGLRTQLFAALGLLVAVVAAAAIVVLGALVYLRAEIQTTVAVAVAQSDAANTVSVTTLLCRRYEKDLFLNLDDPVLRASYLGQWQEAYADLQQAIDRYATLAQTEEDRQQVVAWRQASSAYHDAVIAVAQAIDAGTVTTPQTANAALTPFKEPIRSLTISAGLAHLPCKGGQIKDRVN
ncbi:hypothetical protein SD80_011780 [Scytonema tolypothrichoides VB-61278]|nr:hypothetical protein SD80_011780 [Scytonema tolypothrichoides VB-61278]